MENDHNPIRFSPGKDACGVCEGDGTTCQDCSGIPNGLKVIDLCGQCLLPTDEAYNKRCGVTLGGFEPSIVYHGEDQDILVKASGVEGAGKTVTAICKLDR